MEKERQTVRDRERGRKKLREMGRKELREMDRKRKMKKVKDEEYNGHTQKERDGQRKR